MRHMMRWGLSTLIGVGMIGAVMAAPVVLPHVIPQHQDGDRPASPPLTGDMAEFTPLTPRVPVPPLRFSDDRGRTLDFKALKGKLVVLNFWATWCGPCVEELPTLDALSRDPVAPNVVVVTVSQDRKGAAAVDPFLDARGLMALPRLLDPEGKESELLDVEGLPTTFLVDPSGRLIGSLVGGADWNGGDARRLIAWYAGR